jgi:SRSO17 transposase
VEATNKVAGIGRLEDAAAILAGQAGTIVSLSCYSGESKIEIELETKEGAMTAPRDPKPTVDFIDVYCSYYQDLFPEVRSFENFKDLHVGILSELKRKSLPEIAKVVGLEDGQSLHHFLRNSPWSAAEFRNCRLRRILEILANRSITLIIDETGDPKEGDTTDYVKRQYLGNLGKVDNGIVVVTAYGVIENMTFPLTFEVYKPRERLKEGDEYKTKPEIAAAMIRELLEKGFKIELVLADSLYGESGSNFISILEELGIKFAVAIRSNHSVWMSSDERVRNGRWHKFDRIFSNGEHEERYIREIIFGKVGEKRYWEITTDKEKLPEASTWYVMTKIPGVGHKEVGNIYGLRSWVEYGLKQSKNELGWADFRLTHYEDICKWWEIVCSAYLLVSQYSEQLNKNQRMRQQVFSEHTRWDNKNGWKNLLNNLRLIMQPFIYFNLIKPWLKIFPIPQLEHGFSQLISLMNRFANRILPPLFGPPFVFSSA